MDSIHTGHALRRSSRNEISTVDSHSVDFHPIDSRYPTDAEDPASIDSLEEVDSLLEEVQHPKRPHQAEIAMVYTLPLLVVRSTLGQELMLVVVLVSSSHRLRIHQVFDTFQLLMFQHRIEIEEEEVSVDVVDKREDSEGRRREELGGLI